MTATADRVARAKAAGVLRPLPRRPAQERATRGFAPVDMGAGYPKSELVVAVARAVRWSVTLLILFAHHLLDRLQGRSSMHQRGVRIREAFERMGGTAVKVGQQLAVRVDFLPFEICEELGKLMDAVPPFPVEYAIERLEAVIGAPYTTVFAYLEREPIGAASVACVFRGKLHDGQFVAVKVRRPGVEKMFVADLTLIGFATTALEKLSLVRPDFFRHLRMELSDMFLDELDFAREAHFQSMFRRNVKRDRLRFVSAPAVLPGLSGPDIITSEYIVGYPCADLVRAKETEDVVALQLFADVGIDPGVVGHHLIMLALWSRLESRFFHADPHPGNIIILPGNKLVMLDFGACGIVSSKQSAHQLEMFSRLLERDIGGLAAVTLGTLAPLPDIDVGEMKRRLENVVWNHEVVVLSKDAEWWERTSAALWLALIELSKEFHLPVNLEVLRMTRATLLYDTLACRLDPTINTNAAFEGWLKQARKRARRRSKKGPDAYSAARIASDLGSLEQTLEKGAFLVSQLTRELPKEFIAATSKSAFAAATILRFTLAVVAILGGASLVLLASAGLADAGGNFLEAVRRVISRHPSVLVVIALLGLYVVRLIQTRLDEKDASV